MLRRKGRKKERKGKLAKKSRFFLEVYLEGLQELQNLISRVREHSDNVWVLGDFSLPNLNWPESLPAFKPDCSHKQVYDFFLSIINDFNFTQVVTEPTRQDNILDLFLTTNPTLIMKVNCSPGLGDHDIVSAEALLKVSKGAKIRNRYNQVPHLTQNTNGKVTNSQ